MDNPQLGLLESPAGSHWKRVGVRHHHGINLPLFSLHTATSCGIGEYPDLVPIAEWCRGLGFDIIQLLPLNDTGHDTSPYSALTAFALNPINIGLTSLPYVEEYPTLAPIIKELQKLNSTQRIDYSKVNVGKEHFLAEYYEKVAPRIVSTPKYQQFLRENSWLRDYALFKTLRIHTQWQSWEKWNEERKNPSEETIEALLKEFSNQVSYHIFVQYLCFQQLKEVKTKCNKLGIFLKGDIPILINRESADVWINRSLFKMEYSAGAPPDMYAAEGQNWGYPIYDWDAIAADDYRWWRERLKVASNLYDLYRLDHVVGFFRIWAIPPGLTGREGKFVPEDSAQWISQGETIMRMMLETSQMLPIAEDLGTISPGVRECLSELGICGTKVMRWERIWSGDKEYIKPEEYPPTSMTTVSTHDSDPLPQWWEKSIEDAKEFCRFKNWSFTYELPKQHEKEILRDSHHSGSLFHINLLQEYLFLIRDMTWPDPEDERINVPGIISNRNWTYRFRPSVEEIVSSAPLSETIKSIIT